MVSTSSSTLVTEPDSVVTTLAFAVPNSMLDSNAMFITGAVSSTILNSLVAVCILPAESIACISIS